jgi:hypothetical protein
MTDETARPGRSATTTQLTPILATRAAVTPLQVWVAALLDVLADARLELDRRELETFYDIILIRVSRDAVELGLDEWRPAA